MIRIISLRGGIEKQRKAENDNGRQHTIEQKRDEYDRGKGRAFRSPATVSALVEYCEIGLVEDVAKEDRKY